MASLTQLTWVWMDSGSWWWTGRPGMLRFMGSQRVRHNWVTELNWIRSRRHHWMNQSNHFSMKKYLLLNRQKYWCCLVNTFCSLGKTDMENQILIGSYFSGTLELEQWWLVEWMIWVAGAVGLFIYLLDRSNMEVGKNEVYLRSRYVWLTAM